MNLFVAFGPFVAEGGGVSVDSEGIVTHSPIWPEASELIYGTIASLLIFALLFKFAGPAIKKGLAARTAKIQGELDASADAKAAATTEAANIRQAKGDIAAERERMLADADVAAEALVADYEARLDTEIAELRARAQADIATARTREGDELRAEIARYTVAAVDRAVVDSLDAATQQELIESFIQKVGATA
ncbi:MAG TPA: hypothetical protein PLV68_07195 [Ilumatobacteraceae bacterium]|nr:hypothetical protein [Ilumatobacteraceae bacterium]